MKPIGSRLLVQPIAPPEKSGSILIPESVRQENASLEFRVLALGSKCTLPVKPGDRVIGKRFMGVALTVNNEEYRVLEQDDVLAVYTEEKKK